jgi:hypothetical protein
MTPSAQAGGKESQPLIAVLCRAPIVGEAIHAEFATIADVREFPAGAGDTPGLLRMLRPDAVVVDDEAEALEAAEFARETNSPLVHLSLRDHKVRLLQDGSWEERENGSSAHTVRNLIVGAIFREGRS